MYTRLCLYIVEINVVHVCIHVLAYTSQRLIMYMYVYVLAYAPLTYTLYTYDRYCLCMYKGLCLYVL